MPMRYILNFKALIEDVIKLVYSKLNKLDRKIICIYMTATFCSYD